MFSSRYGKNCTVSWPLSWFRPLNNIEKGMETLRWALNNPNNKVDAHEQEKVKRKVKANVHSTKNS
jgi:hypothetical protein